MVLLKQQESRGSLHLEALLFKRYSQPACNVYILKTFRIYNQDGDAVLMCYNNVPAT